MVYLSEAARARFARSGPAARPAAPAAGRARGPPAAAGRGGDRSGSAISARRWRRAAPTSRSRRSSRRVARGSGRPTAPAAAARTAASRSLEPLSRPGRSAAPAATRSTAASDMLAPAALRAELPAAMPSCCRSGRRSPRSRWWSIEAGSPAARPSCCPLPASTRSRARSAASSRRRPRICPTPCWPPPLPARWRDLAIGPPGPTGRGPSARRSIRAQRRPRALPAGGAGRRRRRRQDLPAGRAAAPARRWPDCRTAMSGPAFATTCPSRFLALTRLTGHNRKEEVGRRPHRLPRVRRPSLAGLAVPLPAGRSTSCSTSGGATTARATGRADPRRPLRLRHAGRPRGRHRPRRRAASAASATGSSACCRQPHLAVVLNRPVAAIRADRPDVLLDRNFARRRALYRRLAEEFRPAGARERRARRSRCSTGSSGWRSAP